MINLPNILHNGTLFSAFPNHLAGKYEPPTIIYTLSNTIHSTLFNFNKFVKDLNLEAFDDENSILPCECEGSEFKDSHHKHIVSGDVKSIVTNVQLRDLFLKGPQYKEPVSIDMKKAKDEIILSIDQLIKQWSTTKKIDQLVFEDWKHTLLEILDKRILNIVNKSNFESLKPLLEQKSIKDSLKALHERFVICPIDKAASNVAFVCKRFYASIFLKELDLYSINSIDDPTYISISETLFDEIITNQKNNLVNLVLLLQMKVRVCQVCIGHLKNIRFHLKLGL